MPRHCSFRCPGLFRCFELRWPLLLIIRPAFALRPVTGSLHPLEEGVADHHKEPEVKQEGFLNRERSESFQRLNNVRSVCPYWSDCLFLVCVLRPRLPGAYSILIEVRLVTSELSLPLCYFNSGVSLTPASQRAQYTSALNLICAGSGPSQPPVHYSLPDLLIIPCGRRCFCNLVIRPWVNQCTFCGIQVQPRLAISTSPQVLYTVRLEVLG